MSTAYRLVFSAIILVSLLGLMGGGILTVIFGNSAWMMHKRKNVELVKYFRLLSYFYGIILLVIYTLIIVVSGDGYTVDIYLFLWSVLANALFLFSIFLLSFFKHHIPNSAEASVG